MQLGDDGVFALVEHAEDGLADAVVTVEEAVGLGQRVVDGVGCGVPDRDNGTGPHNFPDIGGVTKVRRPKNVRTKANAGPTGVS
ncbi:hypothetical protein [Streptomyces halobius]|uniref:Uncharacterized protein n=1 Tax=Streptomyces halobius TaxID=2879846 RepID=A0ABY4M6N9_9ACTN|nr:hypothetical protein [Streptomyces halobius]UQA92050.1 hypothetical protein K9S39_09505 [Streptomyces halobius]